MPLSYRPNWRLYPGLLMLLATLLLTIAPARAANLTAATEAELIAAIQVVNAAGPGSHTITLTADIALTASAPLLDNSNATELLLNGDGHTLDGGGHGPVLSVAAGTTVRVREATVTGGAASDGAGIYNLGALTVEQSRITRNVAAGRGGGIFNTADLTVKDSTLDGNSAGEGGAVATTAHDADASLTILDGGIAGNGAGSGGGIFVRSKDGHSAAVTIKNVTFANNASTTGAGGAELLAGSTGTLAATFMGARFHDGTGKSGGGILARSEGGNLSANVSGTTFAGNSANEGGGLALTAVGGGRTQLLLTGSTLSGNQATQAGGAIHEFAAGGGTTSLTLFNSTLSGNDANGPGGGLHVATDAGTAGANIVYSTFAGNSAGTGGGGLHTAASGGGATATLTATIITGASGAGPACARPSGNIVSTGYNLAGDDSCFLTQGNDQPGTAAGLLPLALNAPGATATHALSRGSAALDRVPIGAAGCGTAIATDQRGVPRPRPSGGHCDAGAYELAQTVYGLFLPVALR